MLIPTTSSPSRQRKPGAILMVALLSFVLSACESEPQGPPPPPPDFEFPINIEATGPDGAPMAGVAVELDGQVVGFTGADGMFQATLIEKPGTEVSLKTVAPDGYRVSDNGELVEKLRVTETIGGELSSLPMTLKPSVVSMRHTYMGWVQANCDDRIKEGACANLPVFLDGEEVARTNDTGSAHFAFEGVPGRTSTVSIRPPKFEPGVDGSVFYEPARPEFELALGYDDTIFGIEQSFTDPTVKEEPRRSARRAPRRPPRRPTKPQAPEEEEEDKDNHIINLW